MAKILICTGIYPPQIGGPAQYAKEVADEFRRRGYQVKVLTYKLEQKLPTLIRHELFFWRTLFAASGVDFILALDTFSVGWPAVAAARIMGKKIVIRTGGDFLWESYVERSEDLVKLRDFYTKSLSQLNWKERQIFSVTRWVLHKADGLIFSTEWQKQIFNTAYTLDPSRSHVVENFYGEKAPSSEPKEREFIVGVGRRFLKLKNLDRLKKAFDEAKEFRPDIKLSIENQPFEKFTDRLRSCYAVVLVSVSDISPNMILEAIRYNKPFILTKETGLYEKLKNVGVFVDPDDVEDMKEKILFLADKNNYEFQREKIQAFNFVHTWSDICTEILAVVEKIK